MKPFYKDELARVYCGDAREVLAELPMGCFDLAFFDPPYSSGARRDAARSVRGSMLRKPQHMKPVEKLLGADLIALLRDRPEWFEFDTMTTWGFSWFLRGLMLDLRRRLPKGGHAYLFSDWRQGPNVFGLCESAGYRVNHQLVWDKITFGMGAYYRNQHELITFASVGQPRALLRADRGSVFHHKAPHASVRLHQTEKPVPLLREILETVNFKRVIDPFMGSGSTLVAAKQLGRKSIGIDIDPVACAIAAKRLEQQAPGVAA